MRVKFSSLPGGARFRDAERGPIYTKAAPGSIGLPNLCTRCSNRFAYNALNANGYPVHFCNETFVYEVEATYDEVR